MRWIDLIGHLERNGCEFLREGNNHTVYVNRGRHDQAWQNTSYPQFNLAMD